MWIGKFHEIVKFITNFVVVTKIIFSPRFSLWSLHDNNDNNNDNNNNNTLYLNRVTRFTLSNFRLGPAEVLGPTRPGIEPGTWLAVGPGPGNQLC